MSAIDRVRKSRGINELAAEIEPLAQSMATLADEARQRIAEVQQASEEQAASWTSQQQQAKSEASGLRKTIKTSNSLPHRPPWLRSDLSMATLADEARQRIAEVQQASEEQ
ncbi:IncQ-type mobilization protein MobB, partial [Serratia marcescens]